MKTIYLSGPMTGIAEWNYPAFNDAAAWYRGRGYTVINPAEFGPPLSKTRAQFLKLDLLAIISQAEFVVVLPGWECSVGAVLEVRVAQAIGLSVFRFLAVFHGNPTDKQMTPTDIETAIRDGDYWRAVTKNLEKDVPHVFTASGEGAAAEATVTDGTSRLSDSKTVYRFGAPSVIIGGGLLAEAAATMRADGIHKLASVNVTAGGSGYAEADAEDDVLETSALMLAYEHVHGDRQDDYGHPLDDMGRTAKLWSAILDTEVTAEQVSLCMVAVKISRECNRPKLDNRVDGAGYFETLNMIVTERERRDMETVDEEEVA